jgi:hypothetical protein
MASARRAMRRRWWLCLVATGGLGVGCAARDAHEQPVPSAERDVRMAVDSVTTLAGTVTMPVASSATPSESPPKTPVPVVLLLSGSGPQDREGTRADLPAYQPWREVRSALLARGMAVLQFDERGVGASTGRFAGATTVDFARDAAAAVARVRAMPGIDAARVAIVGHSEGAVEAMLVAGADRQVAALVLLGAPARPGREIARWQRQELVGSDQARWPASERPMVLAAADAVAESLAVRDPWLRQWFTLDPREVARHVRAPVLLLHGDTDRQVPPPHADELAAVLRANGAPLVQVRHLPRTNHLLLPDGDGDPQGYVRLPDQRIRREVVEAVAAFLAQQLDVTPATAERRSATEKPAFPRENRR